MLKCAKSSERKKYRVLSFRLRRNVEINWSVESWLTIIIYQFIVPKRLSALAVRRLTLHIYIYVVVVGRDKIAVFVNSRSSVLSGAYLCMDSRLSGGAKWMRGAVIVGHTDFQPNVPLALIYGFFAYGLFGFLSQSISMQDDRCLFWMLHLSFGFDVNRSHSQKHLHIYELLCCVTFFSELPLLHRFPETSQDITTSVIHNTDSVRSSQHLVLRNYLRKSWINFLIS